MRYFLIFFFLIISFPSLAKIHIEPYAGYGFTIISKNPPSKEIVSNIGHSVDYFIDGKKYSNLTGGLRLGYRSIGLALGVDMSMSIWKSLKGSNTVTPITSGVFASYNLPLLFRAYGVLTPPLFNVVSIQNEDADTPLLCKQASGVKLGLSYLSIPFLSINFEYQSLFIGGDESICGNWSHTGTVFLNFMI